MLMYITRVYEKIIGNDKTIYTTKRMKIPFTEFFILYNGTAECPDCLKQG